MSPPGHLTLPFEFHTIEYSDVCGIHMVTVIASALLELKIYFLCFSLVGLLHCLRSDGVFMGSACPAAETGRELGRGH